MKRRLLGPHAVSEALRADARAIAVVYVEPDARRTLSAIVADAEARQCRVEERAARELDALADGQRHQGIVAIAGEYSYRDLDSVLRPGGVVVALDEITDPHNFGAIIRSAVAFGASGVITTKDRAAPVTSVVVRASAGATEHARIARVTNLARTLAELAERGMDVLGLAAEGATPIERLPPPAEQGSVLVVGSEGKGLRQHVRKQCTQLVAISMPGPIASLNASVAAGIALFELSRSREAR